eukprot:COSAG04_NODE_1773_length_5613_cov_2.489119_3_plen_77_part_00
MLARPSAHEQLTCDAVFEMGFGEYAWATRRTQRLCLPGRRGDKPRCVVCNPSPHARLPVAGDRGPDVIQNLRTEDG